jgi:uncharacterized sulfatase
MRHLVLAALVTCASVFANEAAAAPDRPNIVIFLADDMSWGDSSVYAERGIETPNMERLAKDGMVFDHAYVASPSCAPSRAALLTGLYPVRNGAMFNHQLPDASHERWPAYFKQMGYEVAAIGKVAHYAQVKEYGFDHASHFTYHEDDCIEATVDWLTERQKDKDRAEKPLCLIVGTNWPHVPWPQQTRYAAKDVKLPDALIDTPATRRWRVRYAEAVSMADRDLGLVYDAARQRLPQQNTLFLFSADHGSQFPFGKWNCYGEGLRTPLIAVWPSRVKPGTRSNAMVSWIDILPTCVDAASGFDPATKPTGEPLDGRSFLPVLLGDATEHRDHIYASHSGDGKMNEYPMRTVRSREWSYIRNLTPDAEFHSHIDRAQPVDGRGYFDSWENRARSDPQAAAILARYFKRPAEELYDLRADPHELHNLAGDPAQTATLANYRNLLDESMREAGDEGLRSEAAHRLVPPASAPATVPVD